MSTPCTTTSPAVMKLKLVDKLRKIVDTELDAVLQGDYDERENILADFDDLLDRIVEYRVD